ncbi:MAG: 5-oxoprolinase subunit PxpB [Saprospiraceae bacterium]
MRILPYGEKAILLEFEQQISTAVSQQVQHWEQAILNAKITNLSYTIPAYASLVLVFDRPIKEIQITIDKIRALEAQLSHQKALVRPKRHLKIPVCYELPYALDQSELIKTKSLTWEEIVAAHLGNTYRVYMLGFSPGFAFMGKLPTNLEVKRKTIPRLKVPSGSVGIAGQQTGIYPDEIPGGWQIIGRTPIPIFAPLRENPFLFQAGDQVQFQAISQNQFLAIQTELEQQTFNWGQLYE